MKKILSFVIVIMIILINVVSYAEETVLSVNLQLTKEVIVKQDAKTVEIVLSIGELTNISEETISAGFEATLDYNKDVFTDVKIEEKNDWEVNNINKMVGEINGEDLKDVYLHTFIPGLKRVRNTGKEIFVSTKINLKDTNCTINIATIKPTISSEDGKERKANIKNCDFRGCKVFGKFQNDNYYIEYESKNLPEEYMSRIKQNNYPDALKNLASSLYLEMLEGRTPKKVKDIKKLRQIVDFDLTSLKKNIWKYRNLIKETKLNISYTGAFIFEYGLESVGKENYYIDLEARALDSYKKGDIEFAEKLFDDIDKETRNRIISLALNDGNIEFARKYKKELSPLQKKYLDAQTEKVKEIKGENEAKGNLRQYIESGNIAKFDEEFNNMEFDLRSDAIKEMYESNVKLDLLEKYLDRIDELIRNDILLSEYNNGNKELTYKYFKNIENAGFKEKIVYRELETRNVNFLTKNYDNIDNMVLKGKILELAFREGDVAFLKDHFYELSNDLQRDAIIKYKELSMLKKKIKK